MIQIEIPRDIRRYEAKLIGPLTTRQSIFTIIGSAIAILCYTLLGEMPMDVKCIICVTFAMPILLFGFVKPFGMKLEQFLLTAFASNVLSPRVRLYKTNNPYAKPRKPMTEKERKEKIKRQKKSKDKELHPFQ